MVRTVRHRQPLLFLLLLAVLVGVVFHAPLTVWMGTLLPDASDLLKAWKEAVLLLAVLLVSYEITVRRKWRELCELWPLRLGTIYVVLHVVVLAWQWQGVVPAAVGLLIDIRFVVFFMVMYAALRLHPMWRRPLLIGSMAAAMVSLGFAVLQVTVLPHDILTHIGYDKDITTAPYLTVDQNYDFVRINGTLRGPNPLGAYAAIIGSLVAALLLMVQRERLRAVSRYAPALLWVTLVCALVALWYSYSRSALVAGVGALGFVVGAYGVRRAPRATFAAAGVMLMALTLALVVFWQTAFVQNVILHTNPEGGSSVGSNDEHVASLETGWTRLLKQPLGAGIGSTGSASLYGAEPVIIENQLLFIAHEVGWLGVLLFLILYGTLLYHLWLRRHDWLAVGLLASGGALVLIGIVLPVWVDDTVAMVWWGLTGVALATTKVSRGILQRGKNKRHSG